MKPTWSKKYKFPGTNGSPEEPKMVEMPKPDPCIMMSQPMNPLSFNSDAIQMIPVDKAVFDAGIEVQRDLGARAHEIFGDGPERFNDRSAWVIAMTKMHRLVVKKHSHGEQTIFVVTPLALK